MFHARPVINHAHDLGVACLDLVSGANRGFGLGKTFQIGIVSLQAVAHLMTRIPPLPQLWEFTIQSAAETPVEAFAKSTLHSLTTGIQDRFRGTLTESIVSNLGQHVIPGAEWSLKETLIALPCHYLLMHAFRGLGHLFRRAGHDTPTLLIDTTKVWNSGATASASYKDELTSSLKAIPKLFQDLFAYIPINLTRDAS